MKRLGIFVYVPMFDLVLLIQQCKSTFHYLTNKNIGTIFREKKVDERGISNLEIAAYF